MNQKALILFIILMIASNSGIGWAGGMWWPVSIESLKRHGENDFVLVVRPTKKSEWGFPSVCAMLEIHGTYNPKHFLSISETEHHGALMSLEMALEKMQVINFGGMGSRGGMEPVNPADPCIVRSLALKLLYSGKDKGVMSFYDRI